MAISVHVTELAWPVDLPGTVAALPGEIAWLDTAAGSAAAAGRAPDDGSPGPAAPATRFGLVAARPIATIEQGWRGPAFLTMCGAGPGLTPGQDDSGWALLRRALSATTYPRAAIRAWLAAAGLPAHAPVPGWIGYLGYELVRQLERLPQQRSDDFGLPLMRLALFDSGVVLDYLERRAWLVSLDGVATSLGPSRLAPLHRRRGEIEALWGSAASRSAPAGGRSVGRSGATCIEPESDVVSHTRIVQRARDYIAAGDVYQVNLAYRVRLGGLPDPLTTFRLLRRRNPATFAALLRWTTPEGQPGAIASVSPELFLHLQEREVVTCPIKGTRPRTGDALLDQAGVAELRASEKDAAELAMIVDLHRNDLGRVCVPGSVRVREPRRIEAHPTVFHTVADIAGRLAAGRGAVDLVAACFPAGSVTGAPKIRAMQIIDELEAAARGAYTGAIGLFSMDGDLALSVAIRTLQLHADAGLLHVGGGIVADSDPAAEFEETLAKGRGIIEALAVAAPPVSASGGSPGVVRPRS